MTTRVILDFPFRGRWLTKNSPARRVPSHGTEMFGTKFSIDFVPVDRHGVSAPITLRTLLSAEPPGNFFGFGAPILAPLDGEVVLVHDAEPDHGARRTLIPQLGMIRAQTRHARAGQWEMLAGNHVVIAVAPEGPFVALVHLKAGSVLVVPGQRVACGDPIGLCGNSGNSTEPHLHLQATDSVDYRTAEGLPIAFRRPAGAPYVPAESEVVEA